MGIKGPSDILQDQINEAYEKSVKETIDSVNQKYFTEHLKDCIYQENIKRLPQLLALLKEGDLKDIIAKAMSEAQNEQFNYLFDKSQSELEKELPTLESLSFVLTNIQQAIEQTTDISDFAHLDPLRKSWLLQIRPLSSSMVFNCQLARHAKNIKQILYPPAMKIPGPRKITFFQRILYLFNASAKERDDKRYLNDVRANAIKFANSYITDGQLVDKLKEIVSSTIAKTMNGWLDPAINGLDKQIKLSKELEPLPLEKTAERVKQKSSTFSALYSGAKAVITDASIFSFGIGYDYAREKFGLNKVQDELISNIEKSKTEDQLNKHVNDAFDKILRAETFDLLVDFAKQMYSIEETAGRFDENHGSKLPEDFKDSLTSFGFKRLHSDPEFKQMLTNMLIELGVKPENDESASNLLAKISYMEPDALNVIKSKFIEGKPDPNNFPKAKDILFREFQALSQNLDKHKGSENYFGLLSVHIRALEEIESKQRLANISNLLPNLDTMMGHNPQNKSGLGFMDFVKKNARQIIQSRLPALIDPLINNVKKTRLEAQALSEDYAQAMREAQTKRINDKKVKRIENESERTSITKRNGQWEQAYQDVLNERAKAKPPKPSEEKAHHEKINQIVLNQFAKEWDKRALPVFNNIRQVISPQLYEQMRRELTRENAPNDIIQTFDKAFKNIDKKPLSGLTHQELAALQTALSTSLNAMLNTPQRPHNAKDPGDTYFTKANADEKQFIVLANSAIANLGTSNFMPGAIAKLFDELIVNDREKLDTTNPSVLEKVVSSYFSEKVATAIEDTFAGPSKLLDYYAKEKKSKNFIALDNKVKSEAKTPAQGWGEYLLGLGKAAANKTGLTAAAGAIGSLTGYGMSAVKETSVISYQTVSGWLAGKEGTDNKTLNKIIIDNTHKAVKEQTFNAFFDMMQQMYALQETTKRFQQSFPSKNKEDNPFNKLGLGRLALEHKDNKENNFLEKVAQSLGFRSTENGTAISSLYYAMVSDQNNCEKLCKAFCDPKNSNNLIMLREAVQTEYVTIQQDIQIGKLANSGNYVAMVLAMNQILANVNKIYQATTAAELYLPDLNAKLGIDNQSTSLYTHLIEQIMHRGSESLTGSGVAYVMQSGISQAVALTQEVLEGTKAALDKEIESRALVSSRHSLTPQLEGQSQLSDKSANKKEAPTPVLSKPQAKPH